MKKIIVLSAALLVMVAAFATDIPTYAPHAFHPGFHPRYGHGMHLRPVYRAHKPFHTATAFSAGRAFAAPVSIVTPSNIVRIDLPSFAEADAAMNATAVMSLTEISMPDYAQADAAINEAAVMSLTEIPLPGFTESDAAINEAAVIEMTEISLPDYAEADADMSSRWSAVVSR